MGISGRRRDDGGEGTGADRLPDVPDTLLVREAKGGSNQAFGQLIRRYQDKIYTIVFSQLSTAHDELLSLPPGVGVVEFRCPEVGLQPGAGVRPSPADGPCLRGGGAGGDGGLEARAVRPVLWHRALVERVCGVGHR